MDTKMLIYRPLRRFPTEIMVTLPEHPSYDQLKAVVIPWLFEGRESEPSKHLEHVTVLHDGKRRDMFVDENGHAKGLTFNQMATVIYHTASIAAKRGVPNSLGIIEGESLIAGTAVLFPDRQVWF